jgi:hypothetical protein
LAATTSFGVLRDDLKRVPQRSACGRQDSGGRDLKAIVFEKIDVIALEIEISLPIKEVCGSISSRFEIFNRLKDVTAGHHGSLKITARQCRANCLM